MENIRKKVCYVILIIILISVLFSNVLFAATGTVNSSSVRIRKGPSTTSEVISVVTKGEKFEVLSEENDWYKVKFENEEGYISKDLVDTDFVSQEETNTSEQATTAEQNTQENTNNQTVGEPNTSSETLVDNIKNTEITIAKEVILRDLPSFISKGTTNIASGTKVQVVDELNRWIKITHDNVTGWVIKENVVSDSNTTVPETPTSNTPSSTTTDATVDNTISSSNTTSQASKSGHITVESARIREKPNGTVIDVVDINDKVEILSEEDGWYKINVGEYKGCYISTKLVKLD